MEKFFTDIFSEEEANVIVFGVPLGKYSQQALTALKETSYFVEFFDLDKGKNLLENIKIADIGDLKLDSLNEITEQTRNIVSKNKIPLILGGNHLLTLFSLQAFENVKVVVFDAHADLYDKYEDEKIREMDERFFDKKINDTTWLRRHYEKNKNVMLFGVRSISEDDFSFLKENVNYFSSNQIHENIQEAKEKLSEFTKDSNVYISLDLDVFDPSVAPAVDHPEPNGLLFREFQELVGSINGRIVGVDTVCLRPIKDNQVTEFLVVRAIFEILSKVK